ncbi:uncharacterized protein M6B38_366730 [Iris pallida]|uniref:Uncharacterized protein n=1 Tax=Iris pallida TaxID=29817 RepID=A0AAX6GGQ7_IRIPA|nr:uncharacterized protein M6B38_366730 [Iris pallida]
MGTCSSVHKSKKPLVPSPRKQKAADGGGSKQPVKMVAWPQFGDFRPWQQTGNISLQQESSEQSEQQPLNTI